jgi:hypothetical protein
VVWKVGSPHTGDTPDTTAPLDLKLSAKKLGTTVRIKAFPAKGFAQTFFDAFEAHQEPDVIAIDNYGIIDGITTKLGAFTGIGSSQTVARSLVTVTDSLKGLAGGRGGWQFLVSTSKNHEVARLLALQPPECDARTPQLLVPVEVQPVARTIADAYLQQLASLKTYEDSDRLVAEGMRRGPLHVDETTTCGYWGNDHLAFISLVSTYESAKAIGQIPVLLVLRKQDTQWRLLTASTDPISNGGFLMQIAAISGVLQGSSNNGSNPNAAELLSPADGQTPVPGASQRFGNFTWRSSASHNVVAEIVEFAYQNDARLFLRLRQTNLTTEQISDGQLWTSRSEWKWRVWSINDAGAVAFSESRSFLH